MCVCGAGCLKEFFFSQFFFSLMDNIDPPLHCFCLTRFFYFFYSSLCLILHPPVSLHLFSSTFLHNPREHRGGLGIIIISSMGGALRFFFLSFQPASPSPTSSGYPQVYHSCTLQKQKQKKVLKKKTLSNLPTGHSLGRGESSRSNR